MIRANAQYFNQERERLLIFEYQLVIIPPVDISEQIILEKTQFSNKYQEKNADKSKPYIALANFKANEAMEETIIRWMNRAISTQAQFSVSFNNYSGFPPHSIYIRVQQIQPLKQIIKALQPIDQYVKAANSNTNYMELITNPHLCIAQQLPTEVFEKAMADYSQKSFSGNFEVMQLALLRRKHAFENSKQISILPLSNKAFS